MMFLTLLLNVLEIRVGYRIAFVFSKDLKNPIELQIDHLTLDFCFFGVKLHLNKLDNSGVLEATKMWVCIF